MVAWAELLGLYLFARYMWIEIVSNLVEYRFNHRRLFRIIIVQIGVDDDIDFEGEVVADDNFFNETQFENVDDELRYANEATILIKAAFVPR